MHGFEHAPDLAIAPLVQSRPIPCVAAFPTRIRELIERRDAVLELDSFEQTFALLGGWTSKQTYCVLALDRITRMHEPMRELTVGHEQQQARGCDIEPAHVDPPPSPRPAHVVENRLASFGIRARSDLARRLIVGEVRLNRTRLEATQRLTVNEDTFGTGQPRAELRTLAIDRDAAFSNPALNLAA